MPEGDTIFRTARALGRAFTGRTLTGSDLRVPALATTALAGWTVVESASRGKHLLLRLRPPTTGQPLTLHSHLGMDGSWRLYRVGERWRGPGYTVRAVLRTTDTVAVGWALRDQRNLAGIGNIYCCELLFLRGLWPWAPVGQVADLPGLVALAHRLLRANRDRPIRSTTGALRRGHTTYVYGRGGAPCRRCGHEIRVSSAGERVTFWCPHCQPAPLGAPPVPERHPAAGATADQLGVGRSP